MSVVARDPWRAVKDEIEFTAQDNFLSVDARIAKLRFFRDDLNDLLGRVDSYTGDLELVREGRDPAFREAVLEAREDADLRRVLLDRGLATPEELDVLGYLAHDDLDKLDEEGLLELWLAEAGGIVAPWEELKHPRGGHGKFRDVLGRTVAPKGRHGRAIPVPAAPVPKAEPMHDKDREPVINVGKDVERAATLLAQGHRVELNQPHQVSTLLDKLAAVVEEAKQKGEKAPTFDLCKVSVKGTNLFCAQSKGIARVQMPQLKGMPTPGSKADKLPKDDKGRVDLADHFKEHLQGLGVGISRRDVRADHLRASQSELNGALTAHLAQQMDSGVRDNTPIFASRDDYIVDGHHRWAATVGVDYRDNKAGDLTMPTDTVDMEIGQLLDEARKFVDEWGMARQDASAQTVPRTADAEPQSPPGTPREFASDELHVVIDRLQEQAREAEQRVTAKLVATASKSGGEMRGLDFRLKERASIESKVRRKREKMPLATDQERAYSITDTLRYTTVLPPDSYVEGIKATISELKKEGFAPDEFENFWAHADDDYDGVHVILKDESGFRFELQFHTPDSFDLKMGPLLSLYHDFREEQDAKKRLVFWDKMVALSKGLERPPGVEAIGVPAGKKRPPGR